MSSSQQSTIIIGAGPAGLTSAYELSKNGLKSVILEADGQVGGLSRTVNYQGYRFDIGGHRFFSKVPYINQIWREILQDEFLVRPRLSRIHYRGHFFDYPLKPLNALSGLGPWESLRIMLSYGKSMVLPTGNGEEKNFEEWVVNRFGYRLYKIFFKTYTEKVWGIPCREISADWAAQRIKNLSLKEAFFNAVFRNGKDDQGQVITTLIEQFYYPRLGPGMMWEHCEALVGERGHQTLRGQQVVRIRHRNQRVESICATGPDGQITEYDGEHFISSMPLRELILGLDPPPPPKVLEAARRLRYRDYLTVVLILNREQVFPDNWIYIHTPEVKLGRIQNYKNWSPEMVPDSSKTSLGLEYFLWEKDEEWRWPDARLIETGIRECREIGLLDPREVEDGTVVRMKKAYPVYDGHYHHSLETIRQYLSEFANLQTIGRNGLHRYNNQDHSMLTGTYAARNILGESYDVWSVNTEKEYHEDGKAPDKARGDRLIPTPISSGETGSLDSADELVEYLFARLDPPALGIAVGTISGIGIFLAAAILLLKGGPVIGPTLSLLSNYLWGFEVTWKGALVGLGEGALGGFAVGYLGASLRNWAIKMYASLVRRRAEKEQNRDILEKI